MVLRKANSKIVRVAVVALFGLAVGFGVWMTGSHLGARSGRGFKSLTMSVQGRGTSVPGIVTLKPGQNRALFVSKTFKTKFQFDAIAPYWKQADIAASATPLSLRVSNDGRHWTNWMPISVMPPQRDNAPHANMVFPEVPVIVVGQYFQYKIDLSRNHNVAPVIQKIAVNYMDTRPSLGQKISAAIGHFFSPPTADASNGVPHVISRAAWGSPDPYGTAFRGQSLYWNPAYHPVTQVFIHHTVDSNYESQVDGAAVVRAIWQYHAITLGWGDIGYNYLVDEAGNVYEGRAGGDNIDGGQVYGYNSGSMGVALIGCFQSNDATCNALNNGYTTGPSSAMLNSLTNLLAWKMTGYGIDPQATHTFCKYATTTNGCLSLPTIAPHSAAYPTGCPGNLTDNDLQYIRDQTASKMAATYSYSAQQLSYNTVNLGDHSQLSVTLAFKNTGSATWTNSGSNPLILATADPPNKTSPFEGTGWPNTNVAAFMNESSVAPGGTGTFTFNIANPPGYTGIWYEYFRLVVQGGPEFGDYFGVPIDTRELSYAIAGQAAYTNSSETVGADLANASPGETAWLVLRATNTGNVTWSNTGPNPVDLGTDGPTDRASIFATGAWMGANRPARLLESSVAPGQTGTFEWPIQIPDSPGPHYEYFTPVAENLTWMNSTGLNYYINVNNNYSWAVAGQYAYTDASKTSGANMSQLSPGQRVYVGLVARNTGNTTWYNSGSHPMDLGTSGPRDRSSPFCDQTWMGCNRPARLLEASVAPGQTGTFEYYFRVPPAPGSYWEHFDLVAEGITWLPDTGLNNYVGVGNYSWSVVGQAAYTNSSHTIGANLTALTPGEVTYWVLVARNTGTATWYNSGSYPMDLGTSHVQDRSSAFCNATWISCNRPAHMLEASVPPGGTATFEFSTTAPNKVGTYREYFNLVDEFVTWLNDTGLNFYTTVQ